MRQIILDTETTGLKPELGHRIIEIGAIEMVNRRLTGEHYHVYINPQREVDQGAYNVHGISNEFLADKPLFKQIVTEFLAFIEGAQLIIHNAPFDVGFINYELKRLRQGLGKVSDRCSIIDTLQMARDKHPGQKNNLDALCKRYDIDNSKRTYHGALLDSEILAAVYLAMTGGQGSLFTSDDDSKLVTRHARETTHASQDRQPPTSQHPPTRIIEANEEELAAHQAFMRDVLEKAG